MDNRHPTEASHPSAPMMPQRCRCVTGLVYRLSHVEAAFRRGAKLIPDDGSTLWRILVVLFADRLGPACQSLALRRGERKGLPGEGDGGFALGGGSWGGGGERGREAALFQLVVDLTAGIFYAFNQRAALIELLAYKLDGSLEHEAFGAPLTLEARHKLRQAVETLADGLSSLLLCEGAGRQPMCVARGRRLPSENAPEAMWFCFFSSSVSRGFSSALGPVPSPGDVSLTDGMVQTQGYRLRCS